jgi:serine/threonine-protein phosphatase 2A regulatory subunit B
MRADTQALMFSQWLSYVSSASFLPDEYQLISRDYLSVKLWDIRMEKVIHTAPVMQQAQRQLSKLYNASALDDEFFMSVSRDGRYVATGGYDKNRPHHRRRCKLQHRCQVLPRQQATDNRSSQHLQ